MSYKKEILEIFNFIDETFLDQKLYNKIKKLIDEYVETKDDDSESDSETVYEETAQEKYWKDDVHDAISEDDPYKLEEFLDKSEVKLYTGYSLKEYLPYKFDEAFEYNAKEVMAYFLLDHRKIMKQYLLKNYKNYKMLYNLSEDCKTEILEYEGCSVLSSSLSKEEIEVIRDDNKTKDNIYDVYLCDLIPKEVKDKWTSWELEILEVIKEDNLEKFKELISKSLIDLKKEKYYLPEFVYSCNENDNVNIFKYLKEN